ncbi:FAD-dependent oxidoreductase [Microbulbifer flavimaris]|uniref:FAD-dependent oxidoreductase n=1 Tax=Microbulbifer flavimaris TaxID=1781068 RepID=A0ABX4HYN1_9GAMM|nr:MULTISPECIES: FAD-dependent oxidoreductase [Microbulbifer]KUJ83069.1 FAD-dependent oxidoreductase [Microbulbifer sp. ZGT114]PCO05255.1 FAD-dependent oxidoreductase [Microbulbifer flavimaris]
MCDEQTRADALQALRDTSFFPYWLDAPERPRDEPALRGSHSCDLLIVGGGFTGLWAAVQAKEANPERDVVLIEARSIAIGASGRPAAILSTSVMHGLANAQRLYPQDMEILERLGKDNLDGFRETIERYGIDCDLEWGGELTVAIGEEGLADIEKEYALYRHYGHDAHLLDEQAVQREVKSPLFKGGLWSKKRSGTVHPAKLAWGLKRVALALGVRIYENSPMDNNAEKDGAVLVSTPRGSIRANKVLLATNAFAAGNKKIRKRVAAIRDRIVLTEPLTESQLAAIGWQNRQGIYDTRTQLNYMRLTADNRILFGGRLDYFFGNNTDPDEDKTPPPYLRLIDNFYRTFPTLRDVRFSHAWSGPIALTTRMAVHYQHYHGGRMLYAGGYSGFGVTATRFGARVALAILDDEKVPERELKFARTTPAYIPPEPFRWIGAKITMYALDTLDEKGGWRVPWVRLVEFLGFPLTPK